ncbi:MAG: hypothetical protein Q8Q39_05185 [bacterium]|nr:hypothetical protein [bacterium]
MRNLLAVKIETKIGVVVIVVWATIFLATIFRARASFDQYLVTLEAQTPLVKTIARIERDQMARWLAAENLNEYGDPQGTFYAGGTPLFDEKTGEWVDPVRDREGSQRTSISNGVDRYRYLVQKFPQKPWKKVP